MIEPSNLRLSRPLAALAVRATGDDPLDDRIVEVGVFKVGPDLEPERYRRLVDPGVPILEAAAARLGVDNLSVAGAAPFAEVAPGLARLLDGCDLAGYGLLGRDLPLLTAEFDRAAVPFPLAGRALADVGELHRRLAPHDLEAALMAYCHRSPWPGLGSVGEAEAAASVLDAMVGRHDGLAETPEGPREAEFAIEGPGLARPRGRPCRPDAWPISRRRPGGRGSSRPELPALAPRPGPVECVGRPDPRRPAAGMTPPEVEGVQ